MLFKTQEGCDLLATAENLTNELREKLALPPMRFVKLETVDRDTYRMPSPTSPELEQETDVASIGRKRAHKEYNESLRKTTKIPETQESAVFTGCQKMIKLSQAHLLRSVLVYVTVCVHVCVCMCVWVGV